MPSGKYEFGEEDEPFFARCCAADMPVVIHIGSSRSKGGGGGGKPPDFKSCVPGGGRDQGGVAYYTGGQRSDVLRMFRKFPI
jgi:hypothetical protein